MFRVRASIGVIRYDTNCQLVTVSRDGRLLEFGWAVGTHGNPCVAFSFNFLWHYVLTNRRRLVVMDWV